MIWEFAGERIAKQFREDIQDFIRGLDDHELSGLLHDLLDDREVGALRKRAKELLETGIYPRPGPDISYPWPPI